MKLAMALCILFVLAMFNAQFRSGVLGAFDDAVSGAQGASHHAVTSAAGFR